MKISNVSHVAAASGGPLTSHIYHLFYEGVIQVYFAAQQPPGKVSTQNEDVTESLQLGQAKPTPQSRSIRVSTWLLSFRTRENECSTPVKYLVLCRSREQTDDFAF